MDLDQAVSEVNLADEIVEITKQTPGGVTHGTLCTRLGDRVMGDTAVFLKGNICIFVGASEEFADAVELLLHEKPKRVVLRPIETLCLLIDGCPMPLKMPRAKRPPKDGYKSPHFAAVCFDLPKSHLLLKA